MVGAARQGNGRKEQTSFCIVDSQSVKNTDSAEAKGYDAGKKVSGIKRHIAVDTEGLPHAIHVTTANVTDRAPSLSADGYIINAPSCFRFVVIANLSNTTIKFNSTTRSTC